MSIPKPVFEDVTCTFSHAVPGVIYVRFDNADAPEVVRSPEAALKLVQRHAARRRADFHVTIVSWENTPEGFEAPS